MVRGVTGGGDDDQSQRLLLFPPKLSSNKGISCRKEDLLLPFLKNIQEHVNVLSNYSLNIILVAFACSATRLQFTRISWHFSTNHVCHIYIISTRCGQLNINVILEVQGFPNRQTKPHSFKKLQKLQMLFIANEIWLCTTPPPIPPFKPSKVERRKY